MQNLGLALLPMLVGYIFKLSNNQYPPVELFFAFMAGTWTASDLAPESAVQLHRGGQFD
jgi:hypothetical protein